MSAWRWVDTPGHSVGHVSLRRDGDRTLIVGDAFVTTAQESVYGVAVQRAEMHGPPMYYTVDWDKAGQSVARVAELEPEVVVTGHGLLMRGPEMRSALHRLAREFDRIAVPRNGRYVRTPARAEEGSAYCDPGN
jgi:glyoxylase-like metal-dependent hydrolase (beta-lactamase superfamily II)